MDELFYKDAEVRVLREEVRVRDARIEVLEDRLRRVGRVLDEDAPKEVAMSPREMQERALRRMKGEAMSGMGRGYLDHMGMSGLAAHIFGQQ